MSAGLTARRKQAMLNAARPTLMRVLAPNRVGLLAPYARQIGFSHFVSLGEHADVDFGDMLDHLASDARTRAIQLYMESVDGARKFVSAARAAARNQPVMVVKAGRSAQGQQAAASHTGALAAPDDVWTPPSPAPACCAWPAGVARFATQPYPAGLVEALDRQGQRLTLRPIRPEDETRRQAQAPAARAAGQCAATFFTSFSSPKPFLDKRQQLSFLHHANHHHLRACRRSAGRPARRARAGHAT